jgi:hypothetical protein
VRLQHPRAGGKLNGRRKPGHYNEGIQTHE